MSNESNTSVQSAGQGAVAHIATRKMDGERFLVWPNNVASYKKYTDDFDVVDLYAAPVNGGERERAIEEAAQIADTFKCGTCGMDGKCAAAIRKLTGERAADAQQVGQCVPLDELYADAAYLSHRVQQGTLSPDDLAKHIRTKIDAALTSPAKVTVDNPDELTPPEFLASHLIDAWVAAHGKQIPWKKAIEISAIVTKMTDEERDRLLTLGDE